MSVRRSAPGRARVLSLAAAAVATAAWTFTPAAAVSALQKGGNKTVYVTAVEDGGKVATDVTKDEWGLREDGADRPIVEAKPATEPLAVALLIDGTQGIQASMNDIRAGLSAFATTLFAGNPSATVLVVGVSGTPTTLLDFKKTPIDAAEVDKAVHKIIPDQSTNGVMVESIADAAQRLAKIPTPRRAIVVVNLEGFGDGSHLTPQSVAQTVTQAGVSLFAVSYQNDVGKRAAIKADATVGQIRTMILNNLPGPTGGERLALGDSDSLKTALTQVASELVGQYAVTFTRPDGPAPKVLLMAVARPGAHILVNHTPPK